MSQTLDSFSSDENSKVLCSYVNATSQIQIARITNIPNWYFERVVFPGQRLVFEAHCRAVLEIHSGMMASAILSDTIPCSKLAVGAAREQNTVSDITVKRKRKKSLKKTEVKAPLDIAV